jgi:hypothetical protein
VIDPAAEGIYARRRPVNDRRAADYLLPPDLGRRIFLDRIVPHLLAGPLPQDRPAVVFLVGQHGAGKTRVAHVAADALARRGGFADLDSDLYKPYHPQYDDLIRGDDRLMAAFIEPDSWAWLAQAHDFVREHKINALKPETGQDHHGAVAHMRAYREAGFRIEVMVLAVPAAMSNQGIVGRYREQFADRGHGRLPVQANADRAYSGILDLAELIDSDHLADEVGVFRRGEAVPRYHNELRQGMQWKLPPALRASVQTERARTWTAEESADFQVTQARLRRELGAEWTQRLDEISGQAQPLIHPSQRAAPEPGVAGHRPGFAGPVGSEQGRDASYHWRLAEHDDPALAWPLHPERAPDLEPEAGA